jgi:hypothetical protein
MTLAEIAGSTKIPLRMLEAIERNDLGRLPSGIFTRAHLRAFAVEVGLDPNDLLQELVDRAALERRPFILEHDIDSQRVPGWLQVTAICALAAALLLYGPLRSSREPAPQPLPSAALPALPPSTPELWRAADSARDDESDPHLPVVRLRIQPDAWCWVSATVDGRLSIYRLMRPDELAWLTAEREIVLRVGDPGAFHYWVNDEPGRPLGPRGRAVTVTITDRNQSTFLAGLSSPLSLQEPLHPSTF